MKNVKVSKKIINITLNILAWLSFFVALVLAITVFFSTFSGTENGKTIFGHKLLIVNSDSMSKSEISKNEKVFFTSGDLIIIKEVEDCSGIEPGDVITFVSYDTESMGETVSHKVRSVKTDKYGQLLGFETYGINTGISDETIVEPSAVIGRYVGNISRVGALFSFFKKPAGFFMSMLIPCLMLLIFFSIKVGKQIAKKELVESMDTEIKTLKDRISRIEEGGVDVTEKDETVIESENQGEVQQLNTTEKALEMTLNTINNTIGTLTHTIEFLAANTEKPVEALTHTVEALSEAIVKPAVVEIPAEENTDMNIVSEVIEEPECQSSEGDECVFENEVHEPEKVPIAQGLFLLDGEVKNYFRDIHNELIAYKKVKPCISNKGIFYCVGRNTIAQMDVRENTLKLCLALNVKKHPKTAIFKNHSMNGKIYRDMLFVVEVKSSGNRDNAVNLVRYFAKQNRLVKDEPLQME